MILILKRLDSATLDGDVRAKLINGGEGAAEEFSMRVVKEQSGRMWKEIVDGKLRVPEEEAAKNIVKTVGGLKEIGPGASFLHHGFKKVVLILRGLPRALQRRLGHSHLIHPCILPHPLQPRRASGEGASERN